MVVRRLAGESHPDGTELGVREVWLREENDRQLRPNTRGGGVGRQGYRPPCRYLLITIYIYIPIHTHVYTDADIYVI